MWPGHEPPFDQRKPLVHCPRCASRLIYTVDTAGYDSEVILDRRCPECEHRDSVVTSALAAAVWYRRDTRILAENAAEFEEDEAKALAAHSADSDEAAL